MEKNTTSGRTRRNTRTDIEWIGGIVSVPPHIEGRREPYFPEMLLWLDANGEVLSMMQDRPGKLLPTVNDSFWDTIEEPMYGEPHSPTRVRVASTELADALRAENPELDVVCAPTPELDKLLTFIQQQAGWARKSAPSYLSTKIGPDAVASFFEAAAELFRAEPWNRVPDSDSLFSVTIEQLGVRNAPMSVTGQKGDFDDIGFIVFYYADDFEDFLDARERDGNSEMPPYFALNFERGADIVPEIRKEVADHHWEICGPNAYPWMLSMEEDEAQVLTGKNVAVAEAVARALTSIMTKAQALKAAWEGGEPVSHTLLVPTHQGDIEVTLCAPYTHVPVALDPSQDIIADLAALARDSDEIDSDACRVLNTQLIQRFVASPEAKGIKDIHACRFVMDVACRLFDDTMATLKADILGEIVFELIPEKMSVEASEAGNIIAELRAFYVFLKREFQLDLADECLDVLGGDAVETLEEGLSDRSCFGPAKSLFMGMKFGQGADSAPDSGVPQPLSKKAAKANKAKRKAARKARKKNR